MTVQWNAVGWVSVHLRDGCALASWECIEMHESALGSWECTGMHESALASWEYLDHGSTLGWEGSRLTWLQLFKCNPSVM